MRGSLPRLLLAGHPVRRGRRCAGVRQRCAHDQRAGLGGKVGSGGENHPRTAAAKSLSGRRARPGRPTREIATASASAAQGHDDCHDQCGEDRPTAEPVVIRDVSVGAFRLQDGRIVLTYTPEQGKSGPALCPT